LQAKEPHIMKRKLISYDVFESIKRDSLSNSEQELSEAAPVLARALEVEQLELLSFGPENVLFEAIDGTYVHASYTMDKENISFENIEQLAIDDETEKEASKEAVSLMLDAIIEGNTDKANSHFEEYVSLPNTHRVMKEGFAIKSQVTTGRGTHSKKKGKKRAGGNRAARMAGKTRKRRDRSLTPGLKKLMDRKREIARKKLGGRKAKTERGQRQVRVTLRRVKPSSMKEWNNICENVFDYIDYKTYGPVLDKATINHDDKGNVVNIAIPKTKTRNEAKLLSFDWNTMATDVKVLRGSGKYLCESNDFCKAIADLKRQNAVSDSAALEESLENIVSQWPNVLYLTQEELTGTIKCALETVDAKNYDDNTCEFMSEGILRTAHHAYVDRVEKIMRLSGAKVNEDAEDKYSEFKNTVDAYFPTLDESAMLEMQVFADLYEAIRNIHELAKEDGNEELAIETGTQLEELIPVLQQETAPSLDIAANAAAWLTSVVETNLETTPWDASGMSPNNQVYITNHGEHPRMAQNASKGYSPAADASGNWGDSAPVSDGKNYKGSLADEMRSRAWGNIGGGDTYPSLQNPYIPSAQIPTMVPATGVDKEAGNGVNDGGSDTWPALQNPYIPQAGDYTIKGETGVDKL